MYTRKGGCSSGINSVKKNGVLDGRYELKTSSNGKYYFNMRASNGTVVGSSEMYQSTDSRDYGIASVKEQAPKPL
ncbi:MULTISPECIES: DUF1508 domain-containing protein [unclassified Sphingobacterium]|uniref:YegP family protein n=1 Tax=unclassified Sphingobacterium TaxID=2609468 RepID=UPI0010D5E0C5|nr:MULTISPECIES: YegP family protein [unclassified Sphingobacterium]MCS3556186.1 uncharacterized protein YegP (UPF0339 family) [Sphingobacterium sp. JUb21]TCR08561.1 uncharacterized protein YegP (UPF0339 family) [Sphingobacterium sp. JUb20]